MKTTFTKKHFLLSMVFFSNAFAFAQAPTCHWVTRLTGSDAQSFTALQINTKGDVYAAGFASQNSQIESFCDTSETILLQNSNSILIKLNAAGDPVWRKDFNQGGGYNAIRKILIDNNENIYITGNCYGPVDFNLALNASSELAPNGSSDLFLAKYDSVGNYIWGKRLGGVGDDVSYLIDFAPDSNIIISGIFNNQIDFGNPGTPNIITSFGEQDNFTAKIDANNGTTQWAKQVGGISFDDVVAQTIDSAGNIYLTCLYMFEQPDVDPGPDVQLAAPINPGAQCAYILKLSDEGEFVWVKQYEGSNIATLSDIEISPDNFLFTYGVFTPDTDFDFSPTNIVSPTDSISATFLAKYDLDGNFIWVKTIGTSSYVGATGWEKLVIGNSGNVYISGFFHGTNDFDTGPGEDIITTPITTTLNPFIACYTPLGDFNWVKTIRNTTIAWGFGLSVDALEKNFYLPGDFVGASEFEPGNSQFNYDGGFYDGYVAKFSFCERIIEKEYVETCAPFYEINGQNLDSSGVYTFNNRSAEGCDSVTILRLKLNNSSSELAIQSCQAVEINGEIYESSGIYQQIFENGTPCDSVLIIQVDILASSSNEISSISCEPINFNGVTYSQSGQFTQVLQNVAGCDSTLTINLDILNLNAQIFQTDSLLYVNGTPTAVQWINCTTGQAIAGATQTSFIPQSTGNYGAVITVGECVDTSNCRQIIISNTPTKTISLCESLVISPNPTTGKIEFSFDKSSYAIQLFSATGALLYRGIGFAGTQQLDLSSLAPALYVLKVDECSFKVVKQ